MREGRHPGGKARERDLRSRSFKERLCRGAMWLHHRPLYIELKRLLHEEKVTGHVFRATSVSHRILDLRLYLLHLATVILALAQGHCSTLASTRPGLC